MKNLRSCGRTLRRLHWTLCALAWTCIAVSAPATITTIKFQPNSVDINDLDHPQINTWRIDEISRNGLAGTGATPSVGTISGWDANPSVRYSHLPDTEFNPGVASALDDPTGNAPATNLIGAFAAIRHDSDSKWLTKADFAGTFLPNLTFTTSDADYTFHSATSQLPPLVAYLGNAGDIAPGLDPGRLFFNDGVKFAMTLTPVPEMEAIYPIISLFAAIAFTRILRRRHAAQLKAIACAR